MTAAENILRFMRLVRLGRAQMMNYDITDMF